MFGPTEGGFYVTTAEILEAVSSGATIEKKAITALGVLNEAYHYAKPSSFSRGLRIELGGIVILLISGTASIDESGVSVHIGDLRAQCRRTFLNITLPWRRRSGTGHDLLWCSFSPYSREPRNAGADAEAGSVRFGSMPGRPVRRS